MRVAIVENDDFSSWHFHRSLIRTLLLSGAEVWVITPAGPFVPLIESTGARHIAVPMERFLSPGSDFRMFVRLVSELRRLRPDAVHTITIKPNTFGVLAAALAGVPRIVSQVPGLGYAFDPRPGFRWRLVRSAVKLLYRIAFRLVDRVWLVNPDDLEFFVASGLLDRRKGVLIRSIGVNRHDYAPALPSPSEASNLRRELDLPDGARVVLMGGRMIWSKGVREFIDAAAMVQERIDDVVFLLAGQIDPGCPDPVPEQYLRQIERPGLRWLGFRGDIPGLLRLAELVVLPSYYREGVPRILLEALACGKPVIAADTQGCREVVEHGANGLLVPQRDSAALAGAIERLLEDEHFRVSCGARSLLKAEEFDEDRVMSSVLRELYGIDSSAEPVASFHSAAPDSRETR